MMNTIYSIGYSGFQIHDFIDILKRKGISIVIDVRSNPYSKYYADYNKEVLKVRLNQTHIRYRNYDKEFGAKQEDRNYYTASGYLDFELFAKSDAFISGVKKLKNAMKMGYTFVLMCAEKDPIQCHRSILIAKAFSGAGYKVIHLLPDHISMTQEDIENRLVQQYFPNRNQISMLEKELSSMEYIREAYKKQNAAIGNSIVGEI